MRQISGKIIVIIITGSRKRAALCRSACLELKMDVLHLHGEFQGKGKPLEFAQCPAVGGIVAAIWWRPPEAGGAGSAKALCLLVDNPGRTAGMYAVGDVATNVVDYLMQEELCPLSVSDLLVAQRDALGVFYQAAWDQQPGTALASYKREPIPGGGIDGFLVWADEAGFLITDTDVDRLVALLDHADARRQASSPVRLVSMATTDLGKTMPPLSGAKTRPLTPVALSSLAAIGRAPLPCQELNPGVANRLERESLVEVVQMPSPYKTHKGRAINHYQLSEAGRAALSAR